MSTSSTLIPSRLFSKQSLLEKQRESKKDLLFALSLFFKEEKG